MKETVWLDANAVFYIMNSEHACIFHTSIIRLTDIAAEQGFVLLQGPLSLAFSGIDVASSFLLEHLHGIQEVNS